MKQVNKLSNSFFFRPSAVSGCEANSDVVFLVGGEPEVERIPAHSWVLIQASPVFRAMFKGPLSLTSGPGGGPRKPGAGPAAQIHQPGRTTVVQVGPDGTVTTQGTSFVHSINKSKQNVIP